MKSKGYSLKKGKDFTHLNYNGYNLLNLLGQR